jgi:hypothetical protein
MKPSSFRRLVLLAALGCASSAFAQPSGAEIKKLTDRYALTRTRIDALLGRRKQPVPLPTGTTLPNPFYIPLAAEPGATAPNPEALPDEEVVVPAAADESDADTLLRYAGALRLAGYLVLNGQPHITVNGAISKVGDVITVGPKDKQVYLHIVAITPQELTLRLNEATQVLQLRK